MEKVLATELKSDVSPLRKDLDAHIERALEKSNVELNVKGVDRFDVSVDEMRLVNIFSTNPDIKVLRIGMRDIEFVWLFQADVDVTASCAERRGFGGRRKLFSYSSPVTRTDTVDIEVVVTMRTDAKISPAELPQAVVKDVELTSGTLEFEWDEVDEWDTRGED
jgi:hypothetical protein